MQQGGMTFLGLLNRKAVWMWDVPPGKALRGLIFGKGDAFKGVYSFSQ